MGFKILSSRNHNSWNPLPTQDLQPLHVRGIPLLQCSCKHSPYFTAPPQGLQTKNLSPVQGKISMPGETRLQVSTSSAENKASSCIEMCSFSLVQEKNKHKCPPPLNAQNNMTVGFTDSLFSSLAQLQQRKDKHQAWKTASANQEVNQSKLPPQVSP